MLSTSLRPEKLYWRVMCCMNRQRFSLFQNSAYYLMVVTLCSLFTLKWTLRRLQTVFCLFLALVQEVSKKEMNACLKIPDSFLVFKIAESRYPIDGALRYLSYLELEQCVTLPNKKRIWAESLLVNVWKYKTVYLQLLNGSEIGSESGKILLCNRFYVCLFHKSR